MKTVDYVDRLQSHLERRASRHMQLIGRDGLLVGIDELPPPLVANDAQRLRAR